MWCRELGRLMCSCWSRRRSSISSYR